MPADRARHAIRRGAARLAKRSSRSLYASEITRGGGLGPGCWPAQRCTAAGSAAGAALVRHATVVPGPRYSRARPRRPLLSLPIRPAGEVCQYGHTVPTGTPPVPMGTVSGPGSRLWQPDGRQEGWYGRALGQ